MAARTPSVSNASAAALGNAQAAQRAAASAAPQGPPPGGKAQQFANAVAGAGKSDHEESPHAAGGRAPPADGAVQRGGGSAVGAKPANPPATPAAGAQGQNTAKASANSGAGVGAGIDALAAANAAASGEPAGIGANLLSTIGRLRAGSKSGAAGAGSLATAKQHEPSADQVAPDASNAAALAMLLMAGAQPSGERAAAVGGSGDEPSVASDAGGGGNGDSGAVAAAIGGTTSGTGTTSTPAATPAAEPGTRLAEPTVAIGAGSGIAGLPPAGASPAGAKAAAVGAGGGASAHVVDGASLPDLLRTLTSAPTQSPGVERTIAVPVSDQHWPSAVAAQVHWMLGNEVQSATLRLSPDHLGPVEVRIEVQNSQVNVNFSASHADTRSALEQAVPRLREMFASSGLTLGQASVQQEARSGSQSSGAAVRPAPPAVQSAEPVAVSASQALGLVDEYA